MSVTPIKFAGSLQGSTCIKMDGDGEVVLRVTVPASELARVVLLVAHREQELEWTVKPKEKL